MKLHLNLYEQEKRKEDVIGKFKDGNVLCAEHFDDDMIDSNTEFIVEDSLQDYYYICDECKKRL